MSYAIIRTGGKQFAVENGQTLRVPTIDGKAGGKVDIEALVLGDGKDAKIGGGATVSGDHRRPRQGRQGYRLQKKTP